MTTENSYKLQVASYKGAQPKLPEC